MSNEGPAGEFVKWLYGNVENARRALAEHLRGLKRPQPAPPLGIPEGDFLKRLPEEVAQRLREMAENTRRGWENIARRASALAEDMRRWPEEVKKYEELREGARGRGVPAPPIGVAVPPRPPEARPQPQPMPPPDYVLRRETPQIILDSGPFPGPLRPIEPVPEPVEALTQVLPPPPPPPRPAQKVTEPVQHMAQTMARAIEELPKVAPVATRPEVKTVQTQPRPVQLAQNVKARKAVALAF